MGLVELYISLKKDEAKLSDYERKLLGRLEKHLTEEQIKELMLKWNVSCLDG